MAWKRRHARKITTGTTKHGRAGVHGRGRHGSPIPLAAKKDAWKHVGQAKKQG